MKFFSIIIAILISAANAIDFAVAHDDSKGCLYAPDSSSIKLEKNSARTDSQIMLVIRNRMPGLINIYRKLELNLDGSVTLKFTVNAGGYAVNSTILSSTTKNKEFDERIKEMVDSWRWKEIEEGETTLTVHFKFCKLMLDLDNIHNCKC